MVKLAKDLNHTLIAKLIHGPNSGHGHLDKWCHGDSALDKAIPMNLVFVENDQHRWLQKIISSPKEAAERKIG